MPNNKASIRKEMKLLRRKNYVLDELAAWNAAKNFFKNFNNPSTVGVYWPMSFELDTRPLIKILFKKKKNCLSSYYKRKYHEIRRMEKFRSFIL